MQIKQLTQKTILYLLSITTFSLTLIESNSYAAQAAPVTVGGSNACQLDWGEVNNADPTGWIFTGNLGDRNDLSRVYHHTPSGLYIKISVAQRWNWNGKNAVNYYGQAMPELPDDNRFVPKITDYSHFGTGGYEIGEHVFGIGINTTAHNLSTLDAQNKLEIEFFSDSTLTQKANVDYLNFVATDLDGGSNSSNNIIEQIMIDVQDSNGNEPMVYFDRPINTVIDNSLINISTKTVTGIGQDIANSTANIAPVVMGDAHKLSLTYKLQSTPTTISDDTKNRFAYISNLSWCRTPSNFPDNEPVDLPYPD